MSSSCMSLRLESVWGLNPKVIMRQRHHHCSISNLSKLHIHNNNNNNNNKNPHSLFTPPRFLTLSFAPPHNHSNHEGEAENAKDDNRIGTEESWKQALDTFREQASKIRDTSQEAYEQYSKKAILVLKDAAEQLSVAAEEIGEESKHYLTTVADSSPEVKEIVETFTSPKHDLTEISQLRDFYVGIPYGLVLSLGGFASFMVTGSIAALRFGIVLGGVLLALSISSLKSYRRGQPSPLTLKAQTAIASILFLREMRLFTAEGSPLVTYFTALISGAVVAFYVYRLVLDYKQHQNGSNLEGGAEN